MADVAPKAAAAAAKAAGIFAKMPAPVYIGATRTQCLVNGVLAGGLITNHQRCEGPVKAPNGKMETCQRLKTFGTLPG